MLLIPAAFELDGKGREARVASSVCISNAAVRGFGWGYDADIVPRCDVVVHVIV